MRARDERGVATGYVVIWMAFLGMVLMGAVVVGGFVAAHHEARQVADHAALAAAITGFEEGDGCPTARQLAEREGLRLTECVTAPRGGGEAARVVVEAEVPMAPPGFPGVVQATAAATAGPG